MLIRLIGLIGLISPIVLLALSPISLIFSLTFNPPCCQGLL